MLRPDNNIEGAITSSEIKEGVEKVSKKNNRKVPSDGSNTLDLSSYKSPKTWGKSISKFFRNQLRSTRSSDGDRPSGSNEQFVENDIAPEQKWQSLGKVFRRQNFESRKHSQDRQGTETYAGSLQLIREATVSAVEAAVRAKCAPADVAAFLQTASARAADAIDRQYLQRLLLCFYEEESIDAQPVEYIELKYEYTGRGRGGADGGAGGAAMVRAVAEAVAATPLPPGDITIQLYYTHDTPSWYQARGFAATLRPAPPAPPAPPATPASLATIHTAHHTLHALHSLHTLHAAHTLYEAHEPHVDELHSQSQHEMSDSSPPPSHTQATNGSSTGKSIDLGTAAAEGGGSADHADSARSRGGAARGGAAGGGAARGGAARGHQASVTILRRVLHWLYADGSATASAHGIRSRTRLSCRSTARLLRLLYARGLLLQPPADNENEDLPLNRRRLVELMNEYSEKPQGDDGNDDRNGDGRCVDQNGDADGVI